MPTFKPLTQKTLEAAIALAEESFVLDFNTDPLRIRSALEYPFYPDKYLDRFGKLLAPEGVKYWIALENEKLIGLIGYYILFEDQADSAWIAWYCVDPAYRNRKIGLQLLDFIIKEVKLLNKKYLRLFSSDIPAEHRAHKVYRESGFVPFREPEFDPKTKTNLIFLQLIL